MFPPKLLPWRAVGRLTNPAGCAPAAANSPRNNGPRVQSAPSRNARSRAPAPASGVTQPGARTNLVAARSGETPFSGCRLTGYNEGSPGSCHTMKIGVVVFPGSNCDHDAFYAVGQVLHQPVEFIWHQSQDLSGFDAVILPGGFSYGDYLRTGAIAKFSPVMRAIEQL